MAVDLHTHSTASDGTFSPDAVVEMAAAAGLTALALTDHDTREGLAEAKTAAARHGIDLVPGIELSLDYDRGGMHLLVLWLSNDAGPLQARLVGLQEARNRRNEAIVELLNDTGMELTIEEVLLEAKGGTVGRPHIAAVMMRHGYVPDIRAAFDLWLGAGRPAYVGRERLGAEEAIGLARESGGVPVLAHPHTLGIHTAHEMADLLSRLREAGLVGLEAEYASYHRHVRAGYNDLARRFGLLPSGGSDFHGDYKPGLAVGKGYGDLMVADEIMDDLASRVP